MEPRLVNGDALLVVDVQEDFVTGALAIAGAASIVPTVNDCIARFERLRLPVFASRDWHPHAHCSFRAQGGLWPPHCVQGMPGAAFAAELRLDPRTRIVSKGTDPSREAHSAFEGTQLEAMLRGTRIRRLFVCGLATEHSVRATVLDALARGFTVFVVTDAMRAMHERAGRKALEEMLAGGAMWVSAQEIAQPQPA